MSRQPGRSPYNRTFPNTRLRVGKSPPVCDEAHCFAMNPAPSPPASEEREPFTWRARAGSFVYAFRGVAALLWREHNAWIHVVAAILACAAGWILAISRLEWCLIVFAIGGVLAAEAFNTAIEALADAVAPRRDPLVGRAKDIAAAGVLIMSAGAAIIGLLVFGPRLLAWLGLR
jgi:diacylglycerol kinase (ATP)